MKNNKKIFILVLLLVIGFASVSATLVITGVLGVSTKKSDFIVKFTNAKLGEVERKDFINADNPKLLNYTIENVTEVGVPTTLNYEVTNTSRVYDAEVSITCKIVNDEEPPREITSEYISMDYAPSSMTILPGETKSGSITTTLIKSSTTAQSINVRCELKAEATERTSLGEEYKEAPALPAGVELIEDKGTIGTLDVGDKIKVGTENFYVISHTDTELNGLAEYNLNVGSYANTALTYGIQQEAINGVKHEDYTNAYYGSVSFSYFSEKNWSAGSDVDIEYETNGELKDALYGENGYRNYIQATIPTADVRLITKYEIDQLLDFPGIAGGSTYINDWADAKEYSWLYSTSYWLGTSYYEHNDDPINHPDTDIDLSYIYAINSEGYIQPIFCDSASNDDYQYGVRPVITIPLS